LDLIHATPPHHGRPVLSITASEGSRLKYVALDLAYMGGIDAGVVCPIFEDSPIVLGPSSVSAPLGLLRACLPEGAVC
jgi:hypothetical protein